ncbi:MAG: mycofactocin biosynthesis chaperone MftB [Actinomycetales bacterium]
MLSEPQSWQLSDSVSLRPEPFGAMAYDFKSRRLTFLKTPLLVSVVESLRESETVGAALDACQVQGDRRATYLAALDRLAEGGMLVPKE